MRYATHPRFSSIGAAWRRARIPHHCRGRQRWDGEPPPPTHTHPTTEENES